MANNDINKSSSLGLVIFILVLVIAAILFRLSTNEKEDNKNTDVPIISDEDNVSDNEDDQPANTNEMIKVDEPQPNSTIKAPLIIKGQARGPWYFEASFPVVLVDNTGKELARIFVQAQGDWMTQDFVHFEGKIESFDPGLATDGELIFEKDNPSGLPENAQSYKVPVKF